MTKLIEMTKEERLKRYKEALEEVGDKDRVKKYETAVAKEEYNERIRILKEAEKRAVPVHKTRQ